MKLILFGPPGAGKGTHAKILSENESVSHLAAGDILRSHIRQGTEVGKRAKAIIERGELVPDTLINELMLGQLGSPEAKPGYILDGYPRTLGQAEALDAFLKKRDEKLVAALYFKTSMAVIIDRLGGRLSCPKCGANYHVRNIPPKAKGRCDRCQADLVQRSDDKPETIRHRLEVYEKETAPLLDYYHRKGLLKEVNGDLDVPELQQELNRVLGNPLRTKKSYSS
jgi:adenylate kinase